MSPYAQYGTTQGRPPQSKEEFAKELARLNADLLAKMDAARAETEARNLAAAESRIYEDAVTISEFRSNSELWERYLKEQSKDLAWLRSARRFPVFAPLSEDEVVANTCEPEKWVVRWCPDHSKRAKAVPQDYCGTKSCALCCKLRDRKASKKVMERFAGGNILRFIITYPEALRAVVDWGHVKLMSKLWAMKIEAFLRKINGLDESWQFGLEDWIHPEGDEEPGVWKPHHNFMVRGEAFRVNLNDEKNLIEKRELRFHLSQEQLTEFRGIIKSTLSEALEYDSGDLENFYYNFVTTTAEPGKRSHFVKYTARAFPRWGHLKGQFTRRYRLFHRGWKSIRAWFDFREEPLERDVCTVDGCTNKLMMLELFADDARKTISGLGAHVAGLTGPPEF